MGFPDTLRNTDLKTFVPIILIIGIFIVNSVSLGINIQTSHNTLQDSFSKGSTSYLYSNPTSLIGNDLYSANNRFEVFNNSVISLSGNLSKVYTFDSNFQHVFTVKSYVFSNLNPANLKYYGKFQRPSVPGNDIHQLFSTKYAYLMQINDKLMKLIMLPP